MNAINKVSIFTAIFGIILCMQANSQDRIIKFTPELIKHHQEICQQMGGISPDKMSKNMEIKLSSGAKDGGVCEFPNTPRSWPEESVKILDSSADKSNGITVIAPSGAALYGHNFQAGTVGITDDPLGGLADLYLSIPDDSCSITLDNVQINVTPTRWYVTCNAIVVGDVSSFASMSYYGESAKGQGVIQQSN